MCNFAWGTGAQRRSPRSAAPSLHSFEPPRSSAPSSHSLDSSSKAGDSDGGGVGVERRGKEEWEEWEHEEWVDVEDHAVMSRDEEMKEVLLDHAAQVCAVMGARTHPRARAHPRLHAHAHTYTLSLFLSLSLSLPLPPSPPLPPSLPLALPSSSPPSPPSPFLPLYTPRRGHGDEQAWRQMLCTAAILCAPDGIESNRIEGGREFVPACSHPPAMI